MIRIAAREQAEGMRWGKCELVHVGEALLERSTRAAQIAQLLDAAERKDDARIAAMQLDDVQIVVAVGEERLIVQRLDVVALHRGLAQHLPVAPRRRTRSC